MTYIPDPIELMEARIDKMADEYIEGHCMICGENVGEGNLHPYTNSPDAPPACSECCGFDDTLEED